MAIVREPLYTSIDPEKVGSGSVLGGSGSKNNLYGRYINGRTYATQRPAVNLREDASSFTPDSKGRGIYYWNGAKEIYLVNKNTVYAGTYTTAVTNSIAADGVGDAEKVYFAESINHLVISVPSANAAYYIDKSVPLVLNPISLPSGLTTAGLAGGVVSLDGYIFLMGKDGKIWNSNLNDATTWSGTDFLTSEREADAGVFLTKHHDNVVAIGSKSVEFFYNAGNPANSPLQRRQDISYRSGANDHQQVFDTGEQIYFIGAEAKGTIGLYQIQDFRLQKRSNDSIDLWINNTLARSKFNLLVSGGYVGEHYLVYLTSAAFTATSGYEPRSTVVFDATYNVWTEFETKILQGTYGTDYSFPVVDVSERGDLANISTDEGVIIFLNGDLGIFNLTGERQDSSGASKYFEDFDYGAGPEEYIQFESDYVSDIGQDLLTNIDWELVTTEIDAGVMSDKFMHRFALVGTTTSDAAGLDDISVSWTDDHYKTFSNPRTLDTGLRRSLNRLGKFKRRAFKLTYDGTDPLRVEEMEFDVRAARYSQR